MAEPHLQLQLGANPRVDGPDGLARELAPLDAALLAWLALQGPTPRARLAQLLWPQKDGEVARNALRQRLFHLRKNVGVDLVQGNVTLALVPGVVHDLDDADTVLGDLQAEFSGEFAQWLEQQRTRRRDRVHRSLIELAEMAERAKDWDDALAHAKELRSLEPLSEDAHRRVMRLHYLAGDRAAALLAFDHCEQVLKHEVGAKPSAQTIE
ncbi:MAG: BTAD domain-containing putative transcriptional regulator, partial [Burkholderiales bacterium]